MDNNKKIIFGMFLTILFLSSVGLSYSYFSNSIVQNEVKDQVVTTGNLELTYTDGPEIKMENIKPGQTITKKVTVKNTGTLDALYNLVWQELNNTITKDEMVISATCKRLNGEAEEEACEGVDETPIMRNTLESVIKKKISIEPGITHEYNVTITFKETNAAQNYNQGKTFSGVLGINEYVSNARMLDNNYLEIAGISDDSVVSSLAFYSDNRVVEGAKSYDVSAEGNNSVIMYVKTNSSNNKLYDLSIVSDDKIFLPVNSSGLFSFYKSQHGIVSNINKIDFNDSVNTSKVMYMSSLFLHNIKLTELDLSGFDTNNVTDMFYMFYNCSSLKTIYVSDKFVTTNVTDSESMFLTGNIVGGSGTTYDANHVDKEYARVDGGTALPGYFTLKNN